MIIKYTIPWNNKYDIEIYNELIILYHFNFINTSYMLILFFDLVLNVSIFIIIQRYYFFFVYILISWRWNPNSISEGLRISYMDASAHQIPRTFLVRIFRLPSLGSWTPLDVTRKCLKPFVLYYFSAFTKSSIVQLISSLANISSLIVTINY